MADKKNNQIPTETRSVGIKKRLSEIESQIGRRKEAAFIAGVSEDMLRRYIKKDSRIAFDPVGLMCDETNISLDWLWSGEGEKFRVGDSGLINKILAVNEDALVYQTDLMASNQDEYRPPAALVSLIIELVSNYGMHANAAPRIIKVMSLIEDEFKARSNE